MKPPFQQHQEQMRRHQEQLRQQQEQMHRQQELMHQQQEQMRQQQEQLRRQQQMGAYYEQQKAKRQAQSFPSKPVPTRLGRSNPMGQLNQRPVLSNYPQTYPLKTGHPFGALLYLVFGMVFTALLGFAAGFLVGAIASDGTLATIAAGIVWLVGFILVVRHTSKIWKGE